METSQSYIIINIMQKVCWGEVQKMKKKKKIFMLKSGGKNRWTSSRGGGSSDQVVFYKKHVIPKDLLTRARR